MSAAQPLGVTGMNTGSLAALLVGALVTASANVYAAPAAFVSAGSNGAPQPEFAADDSCPQPVS